MAIGGLLFSLPAMSGVVEMPEIVDVPVLEKKTLGQMVEEIHVELMAEDEYLPSGYTINELGEISDLSGNIENEMWDRHV